MNILPYSARNLHLWLPGFISCQRRNRLQAAHASGPCRVWLTIADHYEPFWGHVDSQTAAGRVALWRKVWPEIAARHRDSVGNPPQYTFFYAEEHYDPNLLDSLAEMRAAGIADVEVHLHHDGEKEAAFVRRVRRFKEILHRRHSLLREHHGEITFGFIHGNWALDNSHPQGRWCGLNNELTLLRDLGCYADYTLPSAPHRTQTRMVNTIYWATDDPDRPKSHDTGLPAVSGGGAKGDLLLIPGPLGFNCRGSRLFPRLETGELAWHDLSVVGRVRSWLNLAPRIGADIFLKLHTHGAQDKNADSLLHGGLDRCFEALSSECSRTHHELHFVTAWEMRQAIEFIVNPLISGGLSLAS